MTKLVEIPSINRALAMDLIEVGITSGELLKEIGSRDTFERLLEHNPDTDFDTLIALEAAVLNVSSEALDNTIICRLTDYYNRVCDKETVKKGFFFFF